jgi:electron transport complex protein RnfB
MTDEVYTKLAKVLDTLPNGFPATESGVEIRLLKKIFTPEEADLFCDLRLSFETASKIARRTGRPSEGLEEMLISMWNKGQIFGVEFGGKQVFKMLPWIFGIYEMQLNRMDREFAELSEEFNRIFGEQFFNVNPQMMQVIPIERKIPVNQQALVYDQVSSLIEKSKSFAVADCICKKEQRLLGKGCDNPQEVCLSMATVPGIFDNYHWGRPISKQEAYEVLQKSEDAGLVHMTSNVESGHFFICNCCGCCCGVLRAINESDILNAVNSRFYAEIDPDNCIACGTCAEERCQVKAIEEGEDSYRVIKERCIGCGLCCSTCPSEAIRLVRKKADECIPPPKDEKDWFEKRAQSRGVDYAAYK